VKGRPRAEKRWGVLATVGRNDAMTAMNRHLRRIKQLNSAPVKTERPTAIRGRRELYLIDGGGAKATEAGGSDADEERPPHDPSHDLGLLPKDAARRGN